MKVSALIDRTYRRYLYAGGANEPAFDILETGIDDNDIELTTEGLAEFIPQGIIEIGSEAIYTRDAARTPTVSIAARGYRGTTPLAHAAGSLVLIKPEWLRQDVYDAVVEVVQSLFARGLYKIVTTTSLVPDVSAPVALPAGTKDVLSAMVRPNALTRWVPLKHGKDFEVLRVTDPPLLQMNVGHGNSLTLTYSSDFTTPTSEDSDLTSFCGVPDTLAPHLSLAVAATLLRGRELPKVAIEEIRRQLGQGVASGTHVSIADALDREFDQKVTEEKVRLMDRTPPRFEFVN